MKQRMTRAKRAKMAYAAVKRLTYLAGFRAGIEQERRIDRRLNHAAFEMLNRKLKEIDAIESERDEARRELETQSNASAKTIMAYAEAYHNLEMELEKRDTSVCGACKHSIDSEGSLWCEQLRRAVEYDWFCKGFESEEK